MAEEAAYVWKQNNACLATYKVLEGDKFLDQFEDIDIPFAKAGMVKLKTLRYFPKTTANAQIIEVLSLEMARGFLTHVMKVFTVAKQSAKVTSGSLRQSIARIFANGEKTIRDLAEVVDANIKFPDED